MLGESGNPDGLKVFISYPRGGYAHTWAEKIEAHLNSQGVATAWCDKTAIAEGEQDWAGRLEEGVKQADVLVCILIADTGGSDWVKRELLTALEQGTPIVVLRLEPVPLPYLIKEKQPVEHRDNDEDTFSLQRIAQEYASAALKEINAPIPILVQLGRWTRDSESLHSFIGRSLGDLGKHFYRLRDQKRALLLLDGMNEIPPGQRRPKAQQIERLAQGERFVSLVVSCRKKDYQSDFKLPFDTLTLQPLTPIKIREFLHRAYSMEEDDDQGQTRGEAHFWQITGGEAVRDAWLEWEYTGAYRNSPKTCNRPRVQPRKMARKPACLANTGQSRWMPIYWIFPWTPASSNYWMRICVSPTNCCSNILPTRY